VLQAGVADVTIANSIMLANAGLAGRHLQRQHRRARNLAIGLASLARGASNSPGTVAITRPPPIGGPDRSTRDLALRQGAGPCSAPASR